MTRRVVVTGLGAVTPLGIGVAQFWEGLLAGKSGVGPITRFDAQAFSTRIAAEVRDFDPADFMEKKDARRMDRFAQFAVAASGMALEDAGLNPKETGGDRVGVLIGSGIGGIQSLEDQCRNLFERGPGRVSPFFVPMMIPDMASGQVSIRFGARAHNACTVTACASGTNSIGDAYRVILHGDADVMITGGTEAAITPLSMAGFCSARTMSTRNDAPELASRPFDKDRDGFVMGEGAGILILEEAESARRRGAHVYAEVVGYASSADAYHITAPAPEGDGAARAMANALKDAGLDPGDIGYINAHGTSTEYNDRTETAAVKRVFGDKAYETPISSTKSMTGHLLGAAGGVEAIATTLALQSGMIPPTINLDEASDDCDLDYVPQRARRGDPQAALSNSFGFGGHNAVLVFRRWD